MNERKLESRLFQYDDSLFERVNNFIGERPCSIECVWNSDTLVMVLVHIVESASLTDQPISKYADTMRAFGPAAGEA